MKPEFQLGQTIAGKYVVVDELGRGGFGVVYLAVQESVQRYVALKVLQPKIAAAMGPEVLEAFRREALHMSRLHNAHTITLFDYGETPEGVLYLVTQLIDGEPLRSLIDRQGALSIEVSVHILKQVASSLTEAHGIGLVHGDLTPDNVFLLDQPGNEHFVKVLDFGIAKVIGSAQMSGAGNPKYMAPEQFDGGPALPASDIYGAGLVLFEMLTGRPLFADFNARIQARQSPPAVRELLPESLRTSHMGELVEKLTAHDPLLRCPSGMALLRELESLQSRYTVSLDPEVSLGYGEGNPRTTQPLPKLSRAGIQATPQIWGPPPSDVMMAVSSDEGSLVHLVGRTREKASLLAALEGVRNAQGRVVLLGGGKGIGKTTLMRWLMGEVRSGGEFAVGWSSCADAGRGSVSAVSRALADAFSLDRAAAESAKVLRSSIADALVRSLDAKQRLAFLDEHGWIFSPGVRLESTLGELLVALAGIKPLVLFVDELELGTMADLRALDVVATRLGRRAAPVLVLCCLCRDALPGKPDLARGLMTLASRHACFDQIVLGALDESDEVMMVRGALAKRLLAAEPGVDASPELVSVIVRRSHGYPAVIAELVEYLVDGDLLADGDNGLILASDVDADRLMAPMMLECMSGWLGERLGRYLNHVDLQLVLSRSAMLGIRFSEELLLKFLTAEGDSGHLCAHRCAEQLTALMGTLVREDFLTLESGEPGEGSRFRVWSFCQPFMCQYLERLSDHVPNASAAHRLAAEVKESSYAATGESPHRMAEVRVHLERAQRPDPVVDGEGWHAHRVCWRNDPR